MELGLNTLVSPTVTCYGDCNIEVGDNSRIDHGVILMGNIRIGKNTHIPPYCILYGKAGIVIGDFVNLGVFTVLHSESESFTGEWLMGPLVPDELRRPVRVRITIEDYATICSKSTVLPGVTIGRGAILGAHSMARVSVPRFEKWAGSPAKRIGVLSRRCEDLARA